MAPPPVIIDDSNLSRAWARLLLQILDGAGTEVAPLMLSLSGFDQNGAAAEDPAVRQALDRLLKRKSRLVVDDVAFTIFPQRLWEMSRGDRARLFRPLSRDVPALAGDEPQSQWPWPIFRAHGHVWAWPVRRQSTGLDFVSVQF
ncbi:hypothetical protein [Bradyrhizobium sp. RDI18]|uniref:hypothetical protein n=1 Tax=Bradyrhizobium sp. RDI18 TaxID=3367400 RepID=UPI00371C9727